MSRRGSATWLLETELRALTTRRLLAYKATLHAVHETPFEENGMGTPYPHGIDDDPIYSKADPRWQQQMSLVKKILSSREHVPQRRASAD